MKGIHRYCFVVILCLITLLLLINDENIGAGFSMQPPMEYPLVINEVMINNRSSIRDDEGDFVGWIEIFNGGDTPIDLKGFGLSNKSKKPFLWRFPSIVIEPQSFYIVWASGKNRIESENSLHANFQLRNQDKVILLTSPEGSWKDIFLLEPMGENVSYGRKPDGGTVLYGFSGGTPKGSNEVESLLVGPSTKPLAEPLFSHRGGFYRDGFLLTLRTIDDDTDIYYTLDGSIPTEDSILYKDSIPIMSKIQGATVLRARAYKVGYPESKVITQSYFVEEDIFSKYNIPVISLVTDPQNLFDYETGIYIAGKLFDQWRRKNPEDITNPLTPANYNQRGGLWEREASIEFIEANGTIGLHQNVGIRVHGGYSRASEMKTLSLVPRKNYDEKEYFLYDFFDGRAKNPVNNNMINQFSRILLRTSATDRKFSFFRDSFIQSLIQDNVLLDTQSSRAAIVYINGQYYGIHNIREAYDENYVRNYYGIDEKDVVILVNPTGIAGIEVQEGNVGDEMHYNAMINYVKKNNMKDQIHYDYIKSQIDVDNFIEYNVLEIYCDNRDWPGNNVRVWRKRTQSYVPDVAYGHDGRWRWMVFDLDYGFGLYQGAKAVSNNSLKRATEVRGPDWPNPPWSTVLLRSLLKNEEFKNQLINVMADRLNSEFLPEVVLEKIEAMEKIYYPNVEEHIYKWKLHSYDVENWKKEVNVLKNFAIERPQYLRQHFIDYFNLTGIATIQLEMNQGGSVKINTLKIEENQTPWRGVYFKDVPISVEAIPETGYVFVGWEGLDNAEDVNIVLNLVEDQSIKATFIKDAKSK